MELLTGLEVQQLSVATDILYYMKT